MGRPILCDYYRSSAAYRVRIALNLKGVEYDQRPVNLLESEQKSDDYRALNPQGLVPMLEIDSQRLTQSLSIIVYLDQRFPVPPLMPGEPADGAHVRAMALAIACDIHPLNNLRVLKYLKNPLGQEQEAIDAWAQHWIVEGFAALEEIAEAGSGPYLFGDQVTLADVCLVPQMYNARRVRADLSKTPKLVAIDKALNALEPFRRARPEAQPDADK